VVHGGVHSNSLVLKRCGGCPSSCSPPSNCGELHGLVGGITYVPQVLPRYRALLFPLILGTSSSFAGREVASGGDVGWGLSGAVE
jgi:hypothetical protein